MEMLGARYYAGPGGSVAGGEYYSLNGSRCINWPGSGSGGHYRYTAKGSGANIGVTRSMGFFIGTGTNSFDEDRKSNNFSLEPINLTFGYSDGHFASFEIGVTLGAPDIFLQVLLVR